MILTIIYPIMWVVLGLLTRQILSLYVAFRTIDSTKYKAAVISSFDDNRIILLGPISVPMLAARWVKYNYVKYKNSK